MNDEAADDEPLLFRYAPGEDLAYVPVRLDVVDFAQIVLAAVRPDLPKSRIAPQWAAALELSQGAAALAQLVTRPDEEAKNWGPCEMIFPEIDEALDASITAEAAGGFLLGADLLKGVSTTFVGPLGIIAFTLGDGS